MKTETLRVLVIGVLLVTVFAPTLLLRPVSTEAMLIPADPGIAQGQPTLQRQDDLARFKA